MEYCKIGINENFFEIINRHSTSKRQNSLIKRKKSNQYNYDMMKYPKQKLDDPKLIKKYREVIREYNKMRGLIKFDKVYPEMILLASNIFTQHDILDLLVEYFAKRYPQFCIAILTKTRAYIGSKRENLLLSFKKLKKYDVWVVKIQKRSDFINEFRLLIQEQIHDRIDLLDYSEEMFNEIYYNNQYIQERKNLRLANNKLPKKYIRKANLKHEEKIFLREETNFKGSKTIDEYF
ncbi:MAG: DUF4130 domain-containing protein [Candidatus Helarchaeota archaeon]